MSNVPKLRFPGFEGEWKAKKLGDIGKVLMCKRIFAGQTNEKEGVPFYKIGTLGGKPDAFISSILFEEYKSKYNYPRIGEVLITCSGTVGKCLPYNGQDAYYQDSNIVWIENSTKIISNELLLSILQNVNWGKLNSTTITRIYGSDFRDLVIAFPKEKSEQQKIADFLTLIDKKITKQSEKVTALEQYKKGLMQKIFSREIRFKDDNGKDYPEWERKKAKEIFHNISDKNHSGDLVVLSVTQDRGTVIREELSIDIKYDRANLINYKRVKQDNFIISLRSFQGGIDRSNHDGLVSPAYTIFDLTEPEMHDPRYYGVLFKSRDFINRLNTLIYGIRDGKAIGFNDFAELSLYIPKLPEQTKIANFLSLYDCKIEKEKSKLEALREQKKGLLQQMFV